MPSPINTQKIEIRNRTTNQIIENINKTVGILNTTKQRPLQGNGMTAISKKYIFSSSSYIFEDTIRFILTLIARHT